jgi:hypothetical protein
MSQHSPEILRRREGYCAMSRSCVCFLRERFPPDHTSLGSVLLSVLYVCAFWRGEANGLAKQKLNSILLTHRQIGRWVFYFWARYGFGGPESLNREFQISDQISAERRK